MKKIILIYESHQDFFEVIAVYKTQMPRVNVMNNIRQEGIEECAIFGQTSIFILGKWNLLIWSDGAA